MELARLAVSKQSGPNAGPKRPKITKNGAQQLQDGHQGCLPSVFMGRIHSGNVWAASLSCFDRFLPKNGVCWPKLGPGPVRAHNGPKLPKTSKTGTGGIRCPRSSTDITWTMLVLPFCFVSTYL